MNRETYLKCNNKKYCRITSMDEPIKLNSNLKNYINCHKKTIVIFLLIILIILLATFKLNIQIILSSIGLLLLLMVMFVINNTYSIIANNGKLKVDADFNTNYIPYEKLVNIYISETKNKILLLIPHNFYDLKIIFYDTDDKLMEATFSTIMLNPKQLLNFFKKIDFKVLDEQANEDKREVEKNQAKKIIWALIAIVILAILITGFIIYVIKSK